MEPTCQPVVDAVRELVVFKRRGKSAIFAFKAHFLVHRSLVTDHTRTHQALDPEVIRNVSANPSTFDEDLATQEKYIVSNRGIMARHIQEFADQ